MSPLRTIEELLRTLWVGGSHHRDPELPRDLEEATRRAEVLGSSALVDALVSLREALEAEDDGVVFDAQLQVWARVGALRRGLAASRLRERLASGPEAEAEAAPEGWTGVFHPLGAVVRPPRVQIHGLDADGRWRTFAEESIAVDGYEALSSPWISRLFQAELSLGRALRWDWQLDAHPGVDTAARWVGRPAFASRPVLARKSSRDMDVPRLPVSERHGIGRAEVVAQRVDGRWQVRCDGHPVGVSEALELNLDKVAAEEGATVRRDAVVLAGSGQRQVLAWGEPASFPALDPRACTWDPEEVRAQLTGSWGAVARGALASEFGIGPDEAWASVDGFPLPEGADGVRQAFWRQWLGWRLGREVAAVPELLAPVRGAAAGEAVSAERLLQGLWVLEHTGRLEAERAVLQAALQGRLPADEGDVLEAVLQARLVRRSTVDSDPADAAFAERVEEELQAMSRRVRQDGVMPTTTELWWMGDVVAEVRGEAREHGLGRLGLEAARLDRVLAGTLVAWRGRGEAPGAGVTEAWIAAVGSGRTDIFL